MMNRYNLDAEFANACAYTEVVEAGDYVFIAFCVGNLGQSVEAQVNGALDCLEKRLQLVHLTLNAVVKIEVLMRDPWNIPIMEQVFIKRFKSVYPARKTIATEFAHQGGENGLQVQIDAIAYKGR